MDRKDKQEYVTINLSKLKCLSCLLLYFSHSKGVFGWEKKVEGKKVKGKNVKGKKESRKCGDCYGCLVEEKVG
jgi:hypothetical protein